MSQTEKDILNAKFMFVIKILAFVALICDGITTTVIYYLLDVSARIAFSASTVFWMNVAVAVSLLTFLGIPFVTTGIDKLVTTKRNGKNSVSHTNSET